MMTLFEVGLRGYTQQQGTTAYIDDSVCYFSDNNSAQEYEQYLWWKLQNGYANHIGNQFQVYRNEFNLSDKLDVDGMKKEWSMSKLTDEEKQLLGL